MYISHTDLTDPTDYMSHRNHGNHGNIYSKELRNKGMDRLLMDDSHRDDCLILVENEGLILFEES